MRIFTQSVDFLSAIEHHSSIVSFLTCLHYILHSSIIPEIAGDRNLFRSVCLSEGTTFEEEEEQFGVCRKWYRLFVESHTMQFAKCLYISRGYVFKPRCQTIFFDEILRPLSSMRYFTCSLQECAVRGRPSEEMLKLLSTVRSLTSIDVGYISVKTFLELFADAGRGRLQLRHASLFQFKDETGNDEDEVVHTRNFMSLTDVEFERMSPSAMLRVLARCPNLQKLKFTDCSEVPFDLDKLISLVPNLHTLDIDDSIFEPAKGLQNIGDKLRDLTTLRYNSQIERQSTGIPSLDFLTSSSEPTLQLNLQELSLTVGNNFGVNFTDSVHHLSSLRNLRILQLCSGPEQLNDNNIHHLSDLVTLEELFITTGEVTSAGLVSLRTLTGLRTISVIYCALGGHPNTPENLVNFFANLKQLKSVSLDENNFCDRDISDELVDIWKDCGIEFLQLCHNAMITDATAKKLKILSNLTELHLSHVDITSLGFLVHLKNLRSLELGMELKLKPSAFRVFSQEPNSFINLRSLNLFSSFSTAALVEEDPADIVVEHLAKNEHIRSRLTLLNLQCVQFSDEKYVGKLLEWFIGLKELTCTV